MARVRERWRDEEERFPSFPFPSPPLSFFGSRSISCTANSTVFLCSKAKLKSLLRWLTVPNPCITSRFALIPQMPVFSRQYLAVWNASKVHSRVAQAQNMNIDVDISLASVQPLPTLKLNREGLFLSWPEGRRRLYWHKLTFHGFYWNRFVFSQKNYRELSKPGQFQWFLVVNRPREIGSGTTQERKKAEPYVRSWYMYECLHIRI